LIDWEQYETFEYGGKIYTKNSFEIGYYTEWEDLET
jgi:hypothetical protein